MSVKQAAWSIVVVLIAGGLVMAQEEKSVARVSAGEYAVLTSEAGFVIEHKGEPICIGSYFNVFGPDYQGSPVSSRDGWRAGRVSVSEDGHTLTLEATLPQGNFTYSAAVSETGVRVTARVAVAEGVEVGPVEYAAFQIPTGLVEGGMVEVWNAAGAVIDLKPVAVVPKRGAMAAHGQGFTIKTAERSIVVSSPSPLGLYPFDARVEQYGKRQGLWAFTSIPVAAGSETISVVELSVQPPDPPPVVGTIRLAPAVTATAVATAPEPSARESLAADELIEYLARITGKRLDRIEIADAVVPEGAIAVGTLAKDAGLVSQAELDAVKRDGYVVKVAGGRAGLCGWRDVGTVYAAYALLGQLGVRFYAPGCEIVPSVEHLTIAECDLRAEPAYEFRNVTGDLKLGQTPRDDMGNPREIGEPGSLVHAAAYLLPFDMYSEEHPEYFALRKDGTRLRRDPEATRFDVHLCLSNPDVRRISAERLLALIDQQPDRTFFGVSQGDGGSSAWCQCEECQALDAVPGVDMTDRLIDYVNAIAREVAKKYPDKRILTLAYTNATSAPPTRVMPEPNVMVQYCPYPRRTNCQSHDLTCEQNTQALEDLTGWIAKCPDNMYIFDYPRGYKIYYEPFGSFYAMKSKLEFYAANGIRGIYYCGVPTNFRDLFVFVNGRLLWDPAADVEALIDEFMSVYYGAAAPQVREYFDFMHRQVEERQVHQMCEGANPGLVSAEYATTALETLGRAEAAVADDRASLYRVRAEKFCVLFGDVDARNPINGKLAETTKVFAQRLAEFLEIGRTMRRRTVGRRDAGVVTDWLHRIARIRTDRNPWYADPLVDRMIADPPGTLAAEQRLYSQTQIPGGWQVELDAFLGCVGPSEYSHQCPLRRAVWIYGKDTATPAMWALVYLEDVSEGAARLELVAQDDDKPGAVRIRISINGTEVFAGENEFAELGWSSGEFAIPAGALKAGGNEIRFETLDDSPARDAGWFMLAECNMLFE